jgi:hypothetical protein
MPDAPAHAGSHSREVLAKWGIKNIDDLLARGVVKELSS